MAPIRKGRLYEGRTYTLYVRSMTARVEIGARWVTQSTASHADLRGTKWAEAGMWLEVPPAGDLPTKVPSPFEYRRFEFVLTTKDGKPARARVVENPGGADQREAMPEQDMASGDVWYLSCNAVRP